MKPTEDKERTAVLITVYNEGKTIGPLLEKLSGYEYDVYIADDGSVDNTIQVACRYNVEIIRLPINLGQAAASLVGYRIISEKKYDYVVKMDGDGQHDPEYIPEFTRKLKETDCDVVIGSRILGQNCQDAPLLRKIFLRPLTYILNSLSGYKITDSMCGYRAFNGNKINEIVHLFSQLLEPEYAASEMWIRFSKAGIRVEEIPIAMRDRYYGFSHKGLFRYGWGIFVTILRTKLDIYKMEVNK